MGQYYMPILGNKEGTNLRVFNRQLVGQKDDYTGSKLLEHSYWKNNFVNSLSYLIYKNPSRLAWVGDYANEENDFAFATISNGTKIPQYEDIWGNRIIPESIYKINFNLNNKYLVNWETKEYIDLKKCKKDSKNFMTDTWNKKKYEMTLHPLPLLTAIGNGRGGGDYVNGINKDKIGMWAWNLISIEPYLTDEMKKSFKKIDISFKEDF